MAIYRGPGGSGDTTNDASSQAPLVIQKAAEAAASAFDSAASAAEAATSASNAAASATSAYNSAVAAAASAASISDGSLLKSNNLSDLLSVSTARTNLGLGTAATTASTAYATAAQGTNADTAYGWGNHASAGYLTSSTAASTYVSLVGSYSDPTWLTTLAGSKITGTIDGGTF